MTAKSQQHKLKWAGTFQASVYVTSANIPLAKASHVDEPTVEGSQSILYLSWEKPQIHTAKGMDIESSEDLEPIIRKYGLNT